MADITIAASGNASSTTPGAPWPGGVIPSSTDNVIVPGYVTLTIDAAFACANLTVQADGRLIVAEDATLSANIVTISSRARARFHPGSTLNLNAPLAESQSYLQIGTSGYNWAHVQISGTAAKPVTIRKPTGHLGASWISTPYPSISAPFYGEHVRILNLGSAAGQGVYLHYNDWGSPGSEGGSNGGAEAGFDMPPPGLDLRNFVYDGIGAFHVKRAADSARCWFIDGSFFASNQYSLNADTGSTTTVNGPIQFTRCAFRTYKDGVKTGAVAQLMRNGLRVQDCVFESNVGIQMPSGPSTPDWHQFEGNAVVLDTDDWVSGYGNTFHECMVMYSSSRDNPHGWFPKPDRDTVFDRCVFAAEDANIVADRGDAFMLPVNGTVAHSVTLNNCVVLPIRNGASAGECPAVPVRGQGSPDQTTHVKHCTFLGKYPTSGMGEAYGPWANMVAEFRDTLIANFTGTATGSFALGSSSPPQDVFTPSGVHHNGLYGLEASPYAYDYTTSPGVGDVIANPQLVREDTGPCAWDASLGGPGTTRSAVDRLLADPSLWRSSLLPFIQGGIAPTNPVYQAASDTDTYARTWIGAVEGSIAAPTLTVTIKPGNVTLPRKGPRNFKASVSGTANQSVTWTIQSGGGTVNAHGRFIAPDTEGAVVLRATSVEDGSSHAEVTVTVSGTTAAGNTGPCWYYQFPNLDPSQFLTPSMGDIDLLPLGGSPLSDLVKPVRDLPVSPYSDAIMAFFQAPSFGNTYNAGMRSFQMGNNSALPLSVTRSSETAAVPITYGGPFAAEVKPTYSDPGPWPIPVGARVQGYGYPSSPTEYVDGDSHMIVVDADTMHCYEAYHAHKDGANPGWVMANGWYYNLHSGHWCPDVSNADPRYVPPGQHRFPAAVVNAAALPMLPLSVRYEELYEHGEIRHKIGMTLHNVKISGMWVWPSIAIAYSNRNRCFDDWGPTIPYGATLRLKESWYRANVEAADGTPIGTWGPGCRVMLKAYYEYGLILTDGGYSGDIWVIGDSRFHTENRLDNDLIALSNCKLGDFEVVDFEDDLLEVSVSPDVAAEGVERAITVTNRLWERHPDAHPGDASFVAGDGTKPWAYDVSLLYTSSNGTLGQIAAGETPVPGWGLVKGQFSPDHPAVTFKYTPDFENPHIYPFSEPFGISYPYLDEATCPFVVKTNAATLPVTMTITPNPANIPTGGSQQFTANVVGTGAAGVRWSTDVPARQVGGTWHYPMSETGLFTDVGSAASGAVGARLLANQRVTAEATVTIEGDPGPNPGPVTMGADPVRASFPATAAPGTTVHGTIYIHGADGLMDADADPVVALRRNGSALTGVTPSVSRRAAGRYAVSFTLPGNVQAGTLEVDILAVLDGDTFGGGAALALADMTAQIADRVVGRSIEGGADGGRTVGQSLGSIRNRVEFKNDGTFVVYRGDGTTPWWGGVYLTNEDAPAVTEINPT